MLSHHKEGGWAVLPRKDCFVAIRDPINRELIDNFYVEEGEKDFEDLDGLFKSARRQARQVNEKLEEFRQLLKSGQKVGAPFEEILIINSASYGAQGKTIDVADILKSNIISARIRNFPVRNDTLGGDPIPGVRKLLNVKYTYCGEARSTSVPEGSTLSIPE